MNYQVEAQLLPCCLQVVSHSKAWTSLAVQLLIQLLKVLPADFTYVMNKPSLLARQGITTAPCQNDRIARQHVCLTQGAAGKGGARQLAAAAHVSGL